MKRGILLSYLQLGIQSDLYSDVILNPKQDSNHLSKFGSAGQSISSKAIVLLIQVQFGTNRRFTSIRMILTRATCYGKRNTVDESFEN